MRLFADSGCDLPLAFLQDYQVTLFPLIVDINGQRFQDMIDIRAEEVYDAIREGAFPKTYQASLEVMQQAFTELAKSGEQGLYITFSSSLSNMYDTAIRLRRVLLRQYPDLQLEIIDSKCASLGYGLLVDKAARMNDEQLALEAIICEVKKRSHSMIQLLMVDDLRYLSKGGRISKTGALVDELLSIMPIYEMQDGKLVEIEKVRGKQNAVHRMLDLLAERSQNLDKQVICLSHADDVTLAAETKKLIEQRFHPKKVGITMIGSATGSHTGPDALAIFSLDETYYKN